MLDEAEEAWAQPQVFSRKRCPCTEKCRSQALRQAGGEGARIEELKERALLEATEKMA